MAEERVETFAPNGGQVTGVLGLLVALALVVGGVADPGNVPLWVPAVGLLLGVLVWSTTLRPRVWVEPGTLVLRTMLETIRIPLAAVEEVAVRQVMAVRVGERRFVCSGAGRTLRQALKGSAAEKARHELGGGLRGATAPTVESGMIYADYIELRLRDLISEDRTRRGVAAYSAELDALAAGVRRDRAWVEIALLAASAVFVVAALVVR